jgi:hypothetical protein
VGVLLGFTDKTRIHAVGPQGISTAKNARTENSSEKLMAAMFRNIKGISSVEYMKKRSTITAEIYKETIRRLKITIQQKRPHDATP